MAEFVNGQIKTVLKNEPITFSANPDHKIRKRKHIIDVISLEKMKAIMKEVIDESDTWDDFYIGLLEKVYWLGHDEGYASEDNNKWVKISSKLPEYEENVLVADGDAYWTCSVTTDWNQELVWEDCYGYYHELNDFPYWKKIDKINMGELT